VPRIVRFTCIVFSKSVPLIVILLFPFLTLFFAPASTSEWRLPVRGGMCSGTMPEATRVPATFGRYRFAISSRSRFSSARASG